MPRVPPRANPNRRRRRRSMRSSSRAARWPTGRRRRSNAIRDRSVPSRRAGPRTGRSRYPARVRPRFVALAPAAALLGAAACGSDGPREPLILWADDYWVTDDGIVAGDVDLSEIAVYAPDGDAL